ncbi:hypothetical protein [Bradyrhizobium sp. th.b2]|nr:hypothetical protein [Bradyrhizobium sp. th.b2]
MLIERFTSCDLFEEVEMFARILLAGIAAMLLAAPAHAQAPAVRALLSEIGATSAARQIATAVGRRSDLALKIMEGVGFKVESEAAAAQQWRMLSTEQLGTIITHDDHLTRQFLSSQRLTAEDRDLWYSGINTIRRNRIGLDALASPDSSGLAKAPAVTSEPTVSCGQFCRAMLRDAGVTAGVSSTVPLSTYIDALLKKDSK